MAGEEDKRDGQTHIVQTKDPKPLDVPAEVSLEEATGEAGASEEEKKETPEIKALEEYIQQVRAELDGVNTVFDAVQKQVNERYQAFPNVASLSPEERMVELALLSPELNSDMKSFFAKVQSLDLALDGKMGELLKKVYPQTEDEKRAVAAGERRSQNSKTFDEFVQICSHDLGKTIRFLGAQYTEVLYDKPVRQEIAKEKQNPGSADIEKVRRLWISRGLIWERGALLQEDMNSRLVEKDKIQEKDIAVGNMEHVFDVLKDTLDDEYKKVSQKKFKFNDIDESIKKAQVRLNGGALYFILRNISLNALHKKYVDATDVEISAYIENVGEGKKVVLAVKDNGVGIEPGKRTKIFEPGETGAANASEGVGMGLAYTDKRLKSMGMDIAVNSDREKSLKEDPKGKYGSVFEIRIPIVEQAA